MSLNISAKPFVPGGGGGDPSANRTPSTSPPTNGASSDQAPTLMPEPTAAPPHEQHNHYGGGSRSSSIKQHQPHGASGPARYGVWLWDMYTTPMPQKSYDEEDLANVDTSFLLEMSELGRGFFAVMAPRVAPHDTKLPGVFITLNSALAGQTFSRFWEFLKVLLVEKDAAGFGYLRTYEDEYVFIAASPEESPSSQRNLDQLDAKVRPNISGIRSLVRSASVASFVTRRVFAVVVVGKETGEKLSLCATLAEQTGKNAVIRIGGDAPVAQEIGWLRDAVLSWENIADGMFNRVVLNLHWEMIEELMYVDRALRNFNVHIVKVVLLSSVPAPLSAKISAACSPQGMLMAADTSVNDKEKLSTQYKSIIKHVSDLPQQLVPLKFTPPQVGMSMEVVSDYDEYAAVTRSLAEAFRTENGKFPARSGYQPLTASVFSGIVTDLHSQNVFRVANLPLGTRMVLFRASMNPRMLYFMPDDMKQLYSVPLESCWTSTPPPQGVPTVLEGVLTPLTSSPGQQQYKFVVLDVLMWAGVSVLQSPFDDRVKSLVGHLEEDYVYNHTPMSPMVVVRANFAAPANLPRLLSRPQSEYPTEGLILVPNFAYNLNVKDVLHWNHPETTTCFFAVRSVDQEDSEYTRYALSVHDPATDSLTPFGEEYVEVEGAVYKAAPCYEGTIIEVSLMRIVESNHWWEFLGIREDITKPMTGAEVSRMLADPYVPFKDLMWAAASDSFVCQNCHNTDVQGCNEPNSGYYYCSACWLLFGYGDCSQCLMTHVPGELDRETDVFYCTGCMASRLVPESRLGVPQSPIKEQVPVLSSAYNNHAAALARSAGGPMSSNTGSLITTHVESPSKAFGPPSALGIGELGPRQPLSRPEYPFTQFMTNVRVQLMLGCAHLKLRSVLELCCANGVDIKKWINYGRITQYLGVDIKQRHIDNAQDKSVEVLKALEESKTRLPASERANITVPSINFMTGDCFSTDLWDRQLIPRTGPFDVICCHWLHKAFGQMDTATHFMRAVGRMVRPGGLFLGSVIDATKLSALGPKTYNNAFSFEWRGPIMTCVGAQYRLSVAGEPEQAHNVVPWEVLIRLAADNGLHHDAKLSMSFLEWGKINEGGDQWISTKNVSRDELDLLGLYKTFAFRKRAT